MPYNDPAKLKAYRQSTEYKTRRAEYVARKRAKLADELIPTGLEKLDKKLDWTIVKVWNVD